MTIIVTLKYVLLVMRADNDGEGGIMALITLIRRQGVPGGRRTKLALAALGIFGASLFFGDSMITPAISVLSAVEGLKIVEPSLEHLIVPITAAIIVMLFATQRLGTAAVGRLFGPVMVVWFLAIGACGISGIALHPEILKALSPSYALGFLTGHFSIAFFSLAAVVLAITGAEALYADMGHFGRAPITRAWLLLVFPACILSYMGQGALILDNPAANIASPFFLLVPDPDADADGPAGDRGDRDRLPGGDHRRLLRRPPGRAARLPAAAADRPHLGGDGRPDLRARGSTGC